MGLIDFNPIRNQFKRSCGLEYAERTDQAEAEKQTADVTHQRFRQELEDCNRLSQAADAAYANAPSPETGAAVTEADVRVNACQADVQRRWREYDL